jgi:hypothetical protein
MVMVMEPTRLLFVFYAWANYRTWKTMEAKGEGVPREGFVERRIWWTNKGSRVARRRPGFPFDLQGPGATGSHLGALGLFLLVTTWAREGRESLVSGPGTGINMNRA